MLLEGKNWIRFMISVAMACTANACEGNQLSGEDAAAFIRDVLHVALSPSGHRVQVDTIPYPITTKVPLKLTLDGGDPQLFWYYPEQSQDEASERLTDLVLSVSSQCAALATA